MLMKGHTGSTKPLFVELFYMVVCGDIFGPHVESGALLNHQWRKPVFCSQLSKCGGVGFLKA
jgi:hypothetical protein